MLILPFAINGPGAYWQQKSDFSFDQTGGYLGIPPAPMLGDPTVVAMFDDAVPVDFPAAFNRFCLATRTQFVIEGPGTSSTLTGDLADLGWNARKIDDVTVWTVPPGG